MYIDINKCEEILPKIINNIDYDPKYKIEFHRHENFPMVIYAKPNLEKDTFKNIKNVKKD